MTNLSYAIDGGSVTIEDGIKAAEEYAPARKVSVTLNWTPSESDSPDEIDALFNRVTDAASRKVAELLGRTSVAAVSTGAAPAATATATRTRRTKEQIAADAAKEAAAKAGVTLTDTAGAVISDPAAFDVEEEPAIELPPASSGGGSDPASFDLDEEIPAEVVTKEITDADLNAAVQDRNSNLGTPEATLKIRTLIATYRSDATKPFQLREIPADKRQDFLDKLAAIS